MQRFLPEYQALSIVPGETFSILVSYMSQVPRKSNGQLKLKISENDYDETVVELLAESFREDVYLHVPSLDLHFQNNIAGLKGAYVHSVIYCRKTFQYPVQCCRT